MAPLWDAAPPLKQKIKTSYSENPRLPSLGKRRLKLAEEQQHFLPASNRNSVIPQIITPRSVWWGVLCRSDKKKKRFLVQPSDVPGKKIALVLFILQTATKQLVHKSPILALTALSKCR